MLPFIINSGVTVADVTLPAQALTRYYMLKQSQTQSPRSAHLLLSALCILAPCAVQSIVFALSCRKRHTHSTLGTPHCLKTMFSWSKYHTSRATRNQPTFLSQHPPYVSSRTGQTVPHSPSSPSKCPLARGAWIVQSSQRTAVCPRPHSIIIPTSLTTRRQLVPATTVMPRPLKVVQGASLVPVMHVSSSCGRSSCS